MLEKKLRRSTLSCFADCNIRVNRGSYSIRAGQYGLNKDLTTPFVLAALARELEKNNRSSKEVFVPEYRRQIKILLMVRPIKGQQHRYLDLTARHQEIAKDGSFDSNEV